MAEATPSVVLDPSCFSYVVGIDIGSETCCFTVLTPQKQVVIKPTDLANAAAGFALLQERITRLGAAPAETRRGSGGHLALRGESLSLSTAAGVSLVLVASQTNP